MFMSIRRLMVLMALLVCRVESTRCPVMAARTAISAVSSSRISPTSTISGSWRRADDLGLRRFQEPQTGIQRCGLAAARGAGHQDHAMRVTEHAFVGGAYPRRHPQFPELEGAAGLIAQTHDHGFAVLHGHGRDEFPAM